MKRIGKGKKERGQEKKREWKEREGECEEKRRRRTLEYRLGRGPVQVAIVGFGVALFPPR